MNESLGAKVARHYAPASLTDAIASVLEAAGKHAGNLTVDDLEPFDQFHALGKVATLRLARRVGVDATMHVLDVGSGLGGPARFLAENFGCAVTGIDFAANWVEAAQFLTELTRLHERVAFCEGDATALPFANETFDLVWTQAIQLSIADKDRYFSELFRVLKPRCRCAMNDLFGGPGQPTFPAYWAGDPSVSFLITPEETQALIVGAGFEILDWRDTTQDAIRWHSELLATRGRGDAPGIPGLDRSLLFGDALVVMNENMITDEKSGAVGYFEAVLAKPG
jgi:SAM-dependent methyltransferase